jgi:hypothetical protein
MSRHFPRLVHFVGVCAVAPRQQLSGSSGPASGHRCKGGRLTDFSSISPRRALFDVDGTLFALAEKAMGGKCPQGFRNKSQQNHWHEGARCKAATMEHFGWAWRSQVR